MADAGQLATSFQLILQDVGLGSQSYLDLHQIDHITLNRMLQALRKFNIPVDQLALTTIDWLINPVLTQWKTDLWWYLLLLMVEPNRRRELCCLLYKEIISQNRSQINQKYIQGLARIIGWPNPTYWISIDLPARLIPRWIIYPAAGPPIPREFELVFVTIPRLLSKLQVSWTNKDQIRDFLVSVDSTYDQLITLENRLSVDLTDFEDLFRLISVAKYRENVSQDPTLFQILGPVNPSAKPQIVEVMNVGGERMFFDLFLGDNGNDNHDDVDWELEIKTIISQRWFTGTCISECCGIPIINYWEAVRMPLINGGWFGCFCSWNCVRNYGCKYYQRIINDSINLPEVRILPFDLWCQLVDKIESQINLYGIVARISSSRCGHHLLDAFKEPNLIIIRHEAIQATIQMIKCDSRIDELLVNQLSNRLSNSSLDHSS